MPKMKRFIDCYVPVTYCNLKCRYCYIKQNDKFENKIPGFKYNAQYVGKALSKKRLGGICHINICGGGETLIPDIMPEMIKNILKQGHYVFIVTNGTLTKRFDEIANFDPKLLKRLGFKFSFHYEELKQREIINTFFDNIKKVRDAGCSFSVELTPHDELIPHINEIKDICHKNLKSICHITVARRDNLATKPILTLLSKDEYQNVWGKFKSSLFNFKMSTFGVKRKEFCYAGAWSLYVNLGTGIAKQCYSSSFEQNIFDDLSKPIKFKAIGNNCKEAHCYNSHAFLALGLIPKIKAPSYAKLRNRKCYDGTEWLRPGMRDFLNNKLYKNNRNYTSLEQKLINLQYKLKE